MSECATSDCQSIDPLVTPYVDGELPEADRLRIDAHVGRCIPCRERLDAEALIPPEQLAEEQRIRERLDRLGEPRPREPRVRML